MTSKIVIALAAIAMGSSTAYAAGEIAKACCCDKDKMAKEMSKDMPAPATTPAPAPTPAPHH